MGNFNLSKFCNQKCQLFTPSKKFRKKYYIGDKFTGGGEIRICIDKSLKIKRTVKIIAKPYPKKKFQLEISILEHIGKNVCPNIIVYYDFFEDSSGENLLSYISTALTISEGILSKLIHQILSAVAFIHSAGIVHRDIKPENIFFSDEYSENLKIVDFGCYTPKDNLLEDPCGTAEFLSPEMILGKYGRKVDIWSVGVICYMLLFGSYPFNASNELSLFNNIVETEPTYIPVNSFLTPTPTINAINFCKLLLQKDYRARPTALEALEHVWFKNSD